MVTLPPPSSPQGIPNAESPSVWRQRAVVWSVLLSVTGYLGFTLWSGWHDVMAAVAKVGPSGIAVALSLSLTNYALRFVRWQTYLNAMGHPVPAWPSLKVYIAGFALTTTPGKAGEALRSVLLKRNGVPYPTSLAALLSERLSDLLAIVVLALFGLTLYPALLPLVASGCIGVLAALLLLSRQNLLEHLHDAVSGSTRASSLLRNILGILLQARRCHTTALLAVATALSLAAWAAEALAFYLILRWIGLDVSPAFAIFVYATSMLAGALSFMPGGLGGAEMAMVTLLSMEGIAKPDAVAATVLIRLATLWFAVGIGTASCFANKDRFFQTSAKGRASKSHRSQSI